MKETAKTFTLEIETENLAAWMPINNVFSWRKEISASAQPYWNGVLVQLGQYVRWVDDEFMKGFDTIQVCRAEKVVAEIARDKIVNQFDNPTWINICTVSHADTPPMGEQHFKKLLPTRPWNREPCSLDRFFRPFPGCITLWPAKGYRLTVVPNTVHAGYKYTFSIDEPCTMTIVGAGSVPGLAEIDRLVICETKRSQADYERQQGGHQGPPQNP